MDLTSLPLKKILDHFELTPKPVTDFIRSGVINVDDIFIMSIDPTFSDTAEFCTHYGVTPADCANCVILEAKRGEQKWYAACVILGSMRADVNGLARRHLNARSVSFAPMQTACELSRMEYGGITPIGLPPDWPILIDKEVIRSENVIIGSGIRGSKIILPGVLLESLPGAVVLEGLAKL